MTKMEKMEAVVEAARKVTYRTGDDWRPIPAHIQELMDAVRALDAHTEAQEVVTLVAWEHALDGEVFHCRPGGKSDQLRARLPSDWTRLGTVTLPITREGGR